MSGADLQRIYWDEWAEAYQRATSISTDDFHYGPLLPGDRQFRLLPDEVTGLRCLELGCGAGQNSIYLASRGALCTAVDIAERQLKHGAYLAHEAGVEVQFMRADLDDLSALPEGLYDVIHSSYALPFVDAPGEVIRWSARHLAPEGRLVLSVGHPLDASEWVDAAPDDDGIFLSDYFHPPSDERETHTGETIKARYYPVSTWVNWVLTAGLKLASLLEPEPLPGLDFGNASSLAPYFSADWLALYPQLSRIPAVLILAADKPDVG